MTAMQLLLWKVCGGKGRRKHSVTLKWLTVEIKHDSLAKINGG